MNKKVIYQNQQKQVYVENGILVKLFDETFPTSNVLNEALNQSRVQENTDLNVPKIEEVAKIDGKWAIFMQYIEGKTITQLIAENPEKAEEYLDFMVNLQVEMHSKRVPLLPRLKDKMLDKISKTDFDDSVKYELQMRIESMPKHLKLCHGDFNPDNIILTSDGKAYIIDWAHATQGNASCDVARTYLIFCLQGKKDVAEKYLDKFCAKTHTDKKYVRRLLPVVAASRFVKAKEEEQELLSSWIDVVEYE
ncbi:MAG: phosphotransferase [Clostridia bacterium]|nr:phosphotransferase [Clostridia bacterium]